MTRRPRLRSQPLSSVVSIAHVDELLDGAGGQPVAADLLAGELGLLQQQHPQAVPRQVERGGGAARPGARRRSTSASFELAATVITSSLSALVKVFTKSSGVSLEPCRDTPTVRRPYSRYRPWLSHDREFDAAGPPKPPNSPPCKSRSCYVSYPQKILLGRRSAPALAILGQLWSPGRPTATALDTHAARPARPLHARASRRLRLHASRRSARRAPHRRRVAVLRDVFAERGLAVTPTRPRHGRASSPRSRRRARRPVRSALARRSTCRRRHLHRVEPDAAPRPVASAILREEVPDERASCCSTAACRDRTRRAPSSTAPGSCPTSLRWPMLEQALEQGLATTLERLADRLSAFTDRHGAPRLVRLFQHAAKGSRANSTGSPSGCWSRPASGGWIRHGPIEDRWGLSASATWSSRKQRLAASAARRHPPQDFGGRARRPAGRSGTTGSGWPAGP